MPEMPEAENIRRIIEPQIAAQKVMSVSVNHSQIIGYPEEKHTHLIINLSGGNQIRYIDV